jgi:flavodoxin
MKMATGENLELTEDYPLASWHNIRTALFDVASPRLIASSHMFAKDCGTTEEVAEIIREKLQNQYDEILKEYKIDFDFLVAGQ